MDITEIDKFADVLPFLEMVLADFALIDILSGAFWAALWKIILANIVLSGDNAVVIAMASRNLSEKYRSRAILFRSAGAVLLRLVFCAVIGVLLGIPYLKLVGGALLLWIGIKLAAGEDDDADIKAHDGLWAAIWTIVVADAVMSLDNAIAIAAAANGNFILITAGLLISIPIIIAGAAVISSLLARYPWLALVGAGLIGWIAGEVIAGEGRREDISASGEVLPNSSSRARSQPGSTATSRMPNWPARPPARCWCWSWASRSAASRRKRRPSHDDGVLMEMLGVHAGLDQLQALLQVILIDLVMSGDNAIIIGMAVAGLPRENRTRIIFWGIAGATVLRIGFALLTTQLLQIIGLTLAGGLLLLWVAWRMYRELRLKGRHETSETAAAATPKSATQAMLQIIAADISMSLDNVLAVAGAARDHKVVLWIGLGLSVVLMAVASNLIARILDRHRWVAWIGFLVVVYVAASMVWDGTHEVVAATTNR